MRTYVVASLLALSACQAQDVKRLLSKEHSATLTVKTPVPLRLLAENGQELIFENESFHRVLVTKKQGLRVTLNPRGGNAIVFKIPEDSVKVYGESLHLPVTHDPIQGYALRGRAASKFLSTSYEDRSECDGSDEVVSRYNSNHYQNYFHIYLKRSQGELEQFEENDADALLNIETEISTDESVEVLSRTYSGACLAASIIEGIGDALSDD